MSLSPAPGGEDGYHSDLHQGHYPTANRQSFSSPSLVPGSSLSSNDFDSPQYQSIESPWQCPPSHSPTHPSASPSAVPSPHPSVPSAQLSSQTPFQNQSSLTVTHPSAQLSNQMPFQNQSSSYTIIDPSAHPSGLKSTHPVTSLSSHTPLQNGPSHTATHLSGFQSIHQSAHILSQTPLQNLSGHTVKHSPVFPYSVPSANHSTCLPNQTLVQNQSSNTVTSSSAYPCGFLPARQSTCLPNKTLLQNQSHQTITNPSAYPSSFPSHLQSADPLSETPFQNQSVQTVPRTSGFLSANQSAHLLSQTPLQNQSDQTVTNPSAYPSDFLSAHQTGRLLSQTPLQNQPDQTVTCPSSCLSTHSLTHPLGQTQNLKQNSLTRTVTHPSACPSGLPSSSKRVYPSSYSSTCSSGVSTLHRRSNQSNHGSRGPRSNTSVQSYERECVSDQAPPRRSSVSDSESEMVQEDVATLRRRQEDLSDIDSQVYLSVVWQTGHLSLAYYDIDTMLIYLMLDTEETDDFTILKRALHQLQPEKVVASSKQDERLVKFLKQSLSSGEEEGLDDSDVDVLQFLPNVEFSLEICKRRLLSLNLPSLPDHYTDAERTIYMTSLIPFENVCMVRAAGGLLKFLEKMRIGVELEDADTRVPVMGVKIFTLEGQMIVDDTTYSALQIFFREAHPSVYKSGSGSKEGLSLFGILNRCRSQIGSKMLRLWFLRPLKNIEMLKQRHEAIEFFMQSRNIEVLTTLTDCLKHIKNVPRIISRMLQAQASVGDWQALYKTAYHAIYIRDVCRTQPQQIGIFKKISTSFSEALHKIATLISKIVDFEQSAIQNHFVVKTNVDPELDEKKRTYNGLPDFMTKVAREELNRLSPDIVECNIIYLPQIGYLLAIPQTDSNKENYEIEGLEFIFMSNKLLHYRSASTRVDDFIFTELDRLLGDTMCDITDHETSILHRLQNTILEHTDVLYVVMEHAAELDCLMALATCAREFNYVKPELVQDCVLDITGARHPLQELCCTPFVPNDYISGRDGGKVKVLTGPNACGKSVYLKQVALIVYMAQIGSFVPAERAVVGMVDRIFTRVKSLESVSVGLSTFMLDINQMAESLRNATEKSLVIVDEFGKGTETIDGLSLLCSCLKYWLAQDDHCPHVLMSTHFHSLVHEKMLPKSKQLQFLTLETLHNGEELVFLYQVVEGHTTSSYASHTATQAGLPQDIVDRGTQVSELLRQCKPVHRLDTADSSTQLKRIERVVTRFLQLDMESDDLKSFLKDFVLSVS